LDSGISFTANNAPHIFMITNHGTHEWTVIPGLTDTGGQNIFVNQFTDCLAAFGFKITIVNRGGYPHPVSGKILSGLVYKDKSRRIFYLEDSCKEFIRKEDMHEQISSLGANLYTFITGENDPPVMLISHYWDAASITIALLKRMKQQIPHVWVPHSLGNIKKQKTSEQDNIQLRMEERIQVENGLLSTLEVVASTSQLVENSLRNDYEFMGKILFIPPCIDTGRYSPLNIEQSHPVWNLLSDNILGTKRGVQHPEIITEISRTDKTKRKDVLIKAYSRVAGKFPSSLLVVSIGQQNPALASELISLIKECGVEDQTVVLGSVWEWLPALYSISAIYCSPSVMEGFGMSAQEAAACKTPVVASNLIPFATEYLVGENENNIGDGAIIVPADDIQGFANAMESLLENGQRRRTMAENAYHRTIPRFTWKRVVGEFLAEMNLQKSGEAK